MINDGTVDEARADVKLFSCNKECFAKAFPKHHLFCLLLTFAMKKSKAQRRARWGRCIWFWCNYLLSYMLSQPCYKSKCFRDKDENCEFPNSRQLKEKKSIPVFRQTKPIKMLTRKRVGIVQGLNWSWEKEVIRLPCMLLSSSNSTLSSYQRYNVCSTFHLSAVSLPLLIF